MKRLADRPLEGGIERAAFSSLLKLFEEPEDLTNIRRELVIDFLQKYHPSSIDELRRRMAREGIRASDDDLLNVIGELQRDGEIHLSIPVSLESFPGFLIDTRSSWWIYSTILVSLAEIFLVRYNASGLFLGSLRLFLGLALLGLLPGYATVQILFPKDRLSLLEQILLSIVLSVVVSIGLGVILGAGYTFNPMSGVLLSGMYAIVASILAGYRRYSALRGSRQRRFQST